MAGQAEARARSRPGLLSTGVRIDQAHNAVLVFAVIMALEAVTVLERAGNVPGDHAELAFRAENRLATVNSRPWVARSTRLDLESEIRLANLSNVAVRALLDFDVHVIRSAVAVDATFLLR
jgi:hypothetical protein